MLLIPESAGSSGTLGCPLTATDCRVHALLILPKDHSVMKMLRSRDEAGFIEQAAAMKRPAPDV